jgi:integrase
LAGSGRLAGEWEKELREGRYVAPSKITWAEFRKRCEDEKLANLSKGSRAATGTIFNHIERILNPDRLCKLTPVAISKLLKVLRDEGTAKETSTGTHLRHLRAALSWAVDQGMLTVVPKMNIPKAGKSKGRPLTGEEYDRMLMAAEKVRPDDAAVWQRYLTGQWLSGLRLEEPTILSWDEDAPFAVDLTGRRPAFRIAGDAQKSGKDEILPLTPDFVTFLLATPDAERVGPVFKLVDSRTNQPLECHHVGKIVGKIGKRAGIIVNKAEGKFAGAHDLRRSFGNRWAKRVMPAVLQRLMRHASIQTTMTYYVALDADEVADELWAKWADAVAETPAPGNSSGNNLPPVAPAKKLSPS